MLEKHSLFKRLLTLVVMLAIILTGCQPASLPSSTTTADLTSRLPGTARSECNDCARLRLRCFGRYAPSQWQAVLSQENVNALHFLPEQPNESGIFLYN